MKQNLPKKIAIIYSGAKSWGGIETYLELLFANADRAKVNLTLLSLGSWPLTRKLPNAEYRVRTLAGGRFRIRTVFEISKCLRKDSIDLVVSQGTVANAYARAASLLSGVQSLVTVHSDPYFDYPNSFVRFVYAVVEHLTRFPTKHYIAVSEYLKKKLMAAGVKADKVSVILNGVKDPGLDSRLRGNDGGGVVVIGSIGRLHKVKNYVELIRACSKLHITNYKLLIIGEGSERSNLEKQIAELGLRDKVELVGNVDDVSELMSQIDFYVQPSLSEGFGLTVVEAMLAGKPVIVSPCGSLPELVEDGNTGIVMKSTGAVDIAKAINGLLSNKERAQELAVAGQAYAVSNFGVEKWVNETEKTYMEAAK